MIAGMVSLEAPSRDLLGRHLAMVYFFRLESGRDMI
jgi:hypothetical protein